MKKKPSINQVLLLLALIGWGLAVHYYFKAELYRGNYHALKLTTKPHSELFYAQLKSLLEDYPKARIIYSNCDTEWTSEKETILILKKHIEKYRDAIFKHGGSIAITLGEPDSLKIEFEKEFNPATEWANKALAREQEIYRRGFDAGRLTR